MSTKIFLAAVSHIKTPIVGIHEPHYILESFMDLKGESKKTEEYIRWCLSADDFLLDSGAFAFMNKASKTQEMSESDIKKYVDSYIKFINKWDIEKFFEMDLDCMWSYEKVKSVRAYIEEQTHKKCIPVWHLSRGMEEFERLCKEYDYIAVGGIASKEIKASNLDFLTKLCNIAHKNQCKVHGLGYLSLVTLNNGTCPFDTVDGSGWQGHMRAQRFRIDEQKLIKEPDIELSEKKRTWKDNESEGFKVWTEFSKIIEQ